MKWTLTSPDGIGDFLLRLPWLFEMERRGWQLQLLAREPTLEAARLVGLEGDLVPLSRSPYSKVTRSLRNPFASEIAALRRHDPEILFFGPSQPSFFEEQLIEAAPPTRLGGFVLKEDFWPSESILPAPVLASAYELKVDVWNVDSEPARNQRAASQLLGGDVNLAPFRLAAVPAYRHRSTMPAQFLVVSPGYRAGDYFTGLGVQHWIRELRILEERFSGSLVFTGSPGEAAAHAEIHQGLQHPERHQDWTGRLANLCDLAGVLQASEGYVGKDSGTMHLAACLGRPTVAVFGGGHWKRFLPTGNQAAILTVEVPCRGCDWRCHLPEPLCVTDLPMGCVAQSWEDVIKLPEGIVKVNAFPPSAPAREMLASHPQKDFPAHQHRVRSEQVRAQREEALRPWMSRWLQKLRGRTDD